MLHVVVFTVIAFAGWGSISEPVENYFGYCTSGEPKSLEHTIDTAISHVLQFDREGTWGPHRLIEPYRDVADFKGRNPECCTVTKHGAKGLRPTLYSKFTGRVNHYIRVEHTRPSSYKEINIKPEILVQYFAVSNCGHVWASFD